MEDISSLDDAYKELELEPGASADDVKKAFRKLAAKHHPDKHRDNPEAEQKFKRINRAKQIIDNPQKELKQPGGVWEGFDPSNIDFGNGGPIHINFNNSSMKRGPKQRPNPIIDVHLTFKESIDGVSKEVSYKRYNKCNSCNGEGGKPGSNKCTRCDGQGHFTQRQGNVVMRAVCPACNGTGKDFEECSECQGWGTVAETVTSKIQLPFGLRDGQMINTGGGGNYVGQQSASIFGGHRIDVFGNAILRIHVQSDPDMKLDESGQHVVSDINLTLLEALKGKNVKVRTLKGDMTLKVRPGAKNGQTIVAKGYGTGGMGNHVFNVNIEYPENIEKLVEFLENQE